MILTCTQLERLISSVVAGHTANMRHFRLAFEAYLRLFEDKSELLERNGFRGLFSSSIAH